MLRFISTVITLNRAILKLIGEHLSFFKHEPNFFLIDLGITKYYGMLSFKNRWHVTLVYIIQMKVFKHLQLISIKSRIFTVGLNNILIALQFLN